MAFNATTSAAAPIAPHAFVSAALVTRADIIARGAPGAPARPVRPCGAPSAPAPASGALVTRAEVIARGAPGAPARAKPTSRREPETETQSMLVTPESAGFARDAPSTRSITKAPPSIKEQHRLAKGPKLPL